MDKKVHILAKIKICGAAGKTSRENQTYYSKRRRNRGRCEPAEKAKGAAVRNARTAAPFGCADCFLTRAYVRFPGAAHALPFV